MQGSQMHAPKDGLKDGLHHLGRLDGGRDGRHEVAEGGTSSDPWHEGKPESKDGGVHTARRSRSPRRAQTPPAAMHYAGVMEHGEFDGPPNALATRKTDGEWGRKHTELLIRMGYPGSPKKGGAQRPVSGPSLSSGRRAGSAAGGGGAPAAAPATAAGAMGPAAGGGMASVRSRGGARGSDGALLAGAGASLPYGMPQPPPQQTAERPLRVSASAGSLPPSAVPASLPPVRPMTPTTLAGLSSGTVSPSRLLADSQRAIGRQQRQPSLEAHLDSVRTHPRSLSRDDQNGKSTGRGLPPRASGAITGTQAHSTLPLAASQQAILPSGAGFAVWSTG